ncbi:MAG: IS1096 element passenger TnpR family protein [Bacteroidota bacterium]|jgi:hypothetical protein
MATAYKFRVSFEDYDEVSRDIEIRSNQTFLDLHRCIQQAIAFDGSKAASFFISNDYWIKGQEISSQPKTDKEGKDTILMDSGRLCDFIADPHQKIYYVSDETANWSFFIELIKIIPQAEASKEYPICVKSHGDAPKQYAVTAAPKLVIAEEDAFAKLLQDVEGEVVPEDEPEEESIMGDTEDGVELDELEGMGEEGEEEERGEDGESDGAEEGQEYGSGEEDRDDY